MNTTTLNMTTLDGGVIIKKGTAPAPPSGGGGSNLSPDAIIVEPNGWYWGFSDEYVNSENFTHEMVNQALGMLVNFLGARICNSLTYWPMNGAMYRQSDMRSYLNLGAEAHPNYYIRYVSESKNSSPELGENKGVKFDCWRDVFLASGEVTNEDELIQLMSSQFGLVRLSKEEYEALWNSAS